MKRSWTHTTTSPWQTHALGRALGQILQGGDVVALAGPLGAGKTRFVKGLAVGLGVPADETVVSPTFVLVREVVGRIKLYHIDAYRLNGPEDLLALGLEEMTADPGAVVAVEWADRVRAVVPRHACWVALDPVGPRERRVRLSWPAARRLAALRERFGGARRGSTRRR